MASPAIENVVLNEETSEITLVPEFKEFQSTELLVCAESDDEMALLEKPSNPSTPTTLNEKEDGLKSVSQEEIPKSFLRTGGSNLEENLRINDISNDDDDELREPTSFPTGIRFGLLTAAVCLTIGTVGDDHSRNININ
jgi:hypothetical protein